MNQWRSINPTSLMWGLAQIGSAFTCEVLGCTFESLFFVFPLLPPVPSCIIRNWIILSRKRMSWFVSCRGLSVDIVLLLLKWYPPLSWNYCPWKNLRPLGVIIHSRPVSTTETIVWRINGWTRFLASFSELVLVQAVFIPIGPVKMRFCCAGGNSLFRTN